MASQYKTRCPHCEAQFKIGREHLQQAGGKVRCGSCLQIFKATENLVGQPAKKKPAAAPPPGKKPAGSGTPAEEKKPAQRWTLDDAEAAKLSSNQEGEGKDKKEGKEKSATDQPKPPKEERNQTRVSLDGMELSDSFLNMDEDESDQLGGETFSDMAGAGRDNLSANADESWAEALLEELGDDDEPAPSQGSQQDRSAATPPPEAEEDTFAGDEELSALFSEVHSEEEPESAGEPREEPLGLFDEADEGFSEIELPEYSPEPKPRSASRMTTGIQESDGLVKWALLSLAALLVLATQYLVFSFNELARTPQWRPFYASVCEVAGCQLPNRSNVQALRGANLVVRSHPRMEDALVVDAILFNEAAYEQPFPMLELEFTALEGGSVASRRFLPDEYLQGELRELDTMPRDTPVRISFEIMDPGAEAVNYRMRLHPAPRDAS